MNCNDFSIGQMKQLEKIRSECGLTQEEFEEVKQFAKEMRKPIISAREAFVQNIPVIAEMAVDSRELTEEQYQGWKQECLEKSDDELKDFTGKVLHVVDIYR